MTDEENTQGLHHQEHRAEEGQLSGGGLSADERRERLRRRSRNVFLALLALALLIVAVDFIVTRGPGTRDAIVRNIACLRCHAEQLEQMRLSTRHDPFSKSLCTSCHTPHGRRVRESRTGGDFSAWGWLRRTLDRFYLNVLWRVFSGPWLLPEREGDSGSSSSSGKGQDSVLVTAEEELCWTCHASLAGDLARGHQHEPFVKGRCTSCHHPHASSHEVLLHQDTTELCVSCHHIGRELADREVHSPFKRRLCTECHEPHSSEWPSILVMRERALCFSCHPSVAALEVKPVQHDPFERSCSGCHRPHSSKASPLLVTARPELCYDCHPAIRGDFAMSSNHPLSRIGCQGCHVPHASDFRTILHESQPSLCFGCHGPVESLRRLIFQHEPFDADDCTQGCHRPHGSESPPLLQAAEPGLCYRCHAGIEEDFSQVSAHPVGEELKCTGCHEEHASNYRPLLVSAGKQLCYGCHGGLEHFYEADSHTTLVCLKCHKAHGSPHAPILQLPNPEVCLQCHEHYADRPYYHVTRPAYWDRHAGKPLTCTSTCHNPHGSRNNRMLRRPYGERGFGTDNACVVCHWDIGIWH